jgi:hypothetical protein
MLKALVFKIGKSVRSVINRFSSEPVNRFISSVQHLVTILAIVAAGSWFIYSNEYVPRFNMKHLVTHYNIDNNLVLVRVEIEVENVGRTQIKIEKGFVRLNQVRPFEGSIKLKLANDMGLYDLDALFSSSNTVAWPNVSQRDLARTFTIGPNETEVIPFELVIPNDISIFQIYSLFKLGGQSLEWERASYHLQTKVKG